MAFSQTNAIQNIAVTGGTKSVLIQNENMNWNDGTTTLQWYEIKANANGIFTRDPANPNTYVVQMTANLSASYAYRALQGAAIVTFLTTFLQNYYNNQIGLANGTVQPVLT